MKAPRRIKFREELQGLDASLRQEGQRVCNTLHTCLEAFRNDDAMMAEEVIKADSDIESLQKKLAERIKLVIALQSPVASDLRFVLATQALSQRLDQIAHECTAIAEAIGHGIPPGQVCASRFSEIGDLALTRLRRALSEYANHHLEPSDGHRPFESAADYRARLAELVDGTSSFILHVAVNDPCDPIERLLWSSCLQRSLRSLDQIGRQVLSVSEEVRMLLSSGLRTFDDADASAA